MNSKIKKLLMVGLCSAAIGSAFIFGRIEDSNGIATADQNSKRTSEEDGASSGISKAKAKSKEVRVAAVGSEEQFLGDLRLIAENEHLQLYINDQTTEVAIKEKANGYVWYSNPKDRDDDKIAAAVNKTNLASQLLVSYYNDKGHESFMNNFAESIQRKQFEIQTTDKGVKIVYEIGTSQSGLEAIPAVIDKDRFEELILNKIEDERARSTLRTRFFYNEEKQVYERKKMPDYIVKDVVATLQSVGYTVEDAKADNEKHASEAKKEAATPRFVIPLVYELDGEDLIVRIPAGEVVDTVEFPLHNVNVLPFFGAAGTSEDGYMFVPDGTGALIHLNSPKKLVRSYELPIYGMDETPWPDKIDFRLSEKSRLPVFGIKQGEHATVAIIEQGDALATITADTSGKINSYNNVGPQFRFRLMEMFPFRSGSMKREVPQYSALYQDGIALRYTFLSGNSANYVGMATHYRNYLVNKYQLERLQDTANSPFILELVGSIPVYKSFLGVPYQSVEAMTTYNQAISLLSMLKEQDIDNIQLKYSGWFNKGVDHQFPDDVNPDSVLGGKKDFQKLVQYTKDNQIGLYPDVALLRVYEEGHGFKPSRDSAEFIQRDNVLIYDRSIVTGQFMDPLYYLLSPRKLPDLVQSFLDSYATYGVDGISLRDLGDGLHSSVSKKETIDRPKTQQIVVDQEKLIQGKLNNVMVNGGNAYSLPSAKTIVNAPLASNKFQIIDEEVPFYSIALHGYFDIAGMPINMDRNQDERSRLLLNLETGSNVYYEWFYGDQSSVRLTKFDYLYSANYRNWFDEAVQFYKETDPFLKQVRGQTITGHRKLADNVFETTYEKGQTVIVNYNKTDVVVDGVRIAAQNYRIGGELK
ncbi:DUF5696 domain-containing protein [Paenibacillus sp. GCM10027629]|uniref:DUF5696 domain-containing protein n=1 Tax=Paenibacillus sp. GCM10027629 TaxID=3273414 RepID=UPI0036425ED0